MSDPTRLFGDADDGGARFRQYLRERLGGISSHDVGPTPRSRIPPDCTGHPDPMHPEHHRQCVVADRWERACLLGNCQYHDAYAMKPDDHMDCPGHRGERRVVDGKCRIRWTHCTRRITWGQVHEQTGKQAKPVRSSKLLVGDRRAPWDREPGAEG